jgi:hypothetical protein
VIESEYEDGVMEVCEICHKTQFFKLIDGKSDNLSYMNWHTRNALPPSHPLFYHEFMYDPFEPGIASPYQYD